jgi:hypothetical protein
MRATLRFHWLMMLVAIVGVDLCAEPLLAQAHVATLDEMRGLLSPGDLISVVQTAEAPVIGQLMRFGDADLDIRAETRAAGGRPGQRLVVTVPRSAIQSLERYRDSSRNGALIGAAIGGDVGLAMFVYAAAVDVNEIDEWGPTYLALGGAFSGIGALAGWGIDFAHSKPRIRFDASSPSTFEIRVMPSLSRGQGVALAISF